MIKHINDVDVNYIEYGEGQPIVLLHGWGQNIEMMKPVGDKLNGRIIIVDLPGYGYAQAPENLVKQWQKVIFAYLHF